MNNNSTGMLVELDSCVGCYSYRLPARRSKRMLSKVADEFNTSRHNDSTAKSYPYERVSKPVWLACRTSQHPFLSLVREFGRRGA